MFIDTVKITIKSGNGGNGTVSFFRTKSNPKGGPDGGDGGPGGDIVFQGESSLYTLLDFKYKKFFRAESGGKGSSRYRTGKTGKDIIIKVPCGTKIIDTNSGKILADIIKDKEKVTILKGGQGGKGNKFFAGPENTTPRNFTPGKEGQELTVLLDLYIIADIGIIGFPNAGKSSFLSTISNAKPKIANYPFTTLSPHLGVLEINNLPMVFADIPGLITGSSKGQGLGNKFLKHIERTRMLLHIIDGSIIKQDQSIYNNLNLINNELSEWNPKLLELEHLYAINKIDLLDTKEIEKIKKELDEKNITHFFISCKENLGIDALAGAIYDKLNSMRNKD